MMPGKDQGEMSSWEQCMLEQTMWNCLFGRPKMIKTLDISHGLIEYAFEARWKDQTYVKMLST